MELEEMQAAWTAMSSELEQQKKLTNELIMNMTQERYKNTWSLLWNAERLASLVCYGFLIFLLLKFALLDTVLLKVCGVLAAIIMAIIPVLSLRSIRNIKEVNLSTASVRETIATYTTQKQKFLSFQKFNVALSFVFMLVSVPVTIKILNGRNIFTDFGHKLWFVIPFMLLFFVGFFWLIYRWYKHMFQRSQKLIDEAKQLQK